MIYADHGATSYPKPPVVKEAVSAYFTQYGANPGRSAHGMALSTARKIFEARVCLNDFFEGIDPSCWAFCQNGSEALNMAIWGSLSPGDHAICTVLSHNSVLRPLYALKEKGMELSVLPCDKEGFISPLAVSNSIGPKTKLMVLNHASNVLGSIQNAKEIAEISRRKGVLFLLDAAQTAGSFPFSLKEIPLSFMAVTGHKGLWGPQGIGALYVAEPKALHPVKMGGTGSHSHELFQPMEMPDMLEVGTPNTPGILGWMAGIRAIQEIGISQIRAHEIRLTQMFLEGLSAMPHYQVYGTQDVHLKMPIILVNHQRIDASALGFLLSEKYEIFTRTGLHCAPLAHEAMGTLEKGGVRFSFGYTNTEQDIRTCLGALAEIDKMEGRM